MQSDSSETRRPTHEGIGLIDTTSNHAAARLSANKLSPREAAGETTARLDAIAPDAPADALIEKAVRDLNGICRLATLEFSLTVGEYIIETFFGGDVQAFRQRCPTKLSSIRKLARHPHLAMSPSTLYRSVAIYELCERLGVRRWKHVSTTHLRQVLPLDSAAQARLLRTTESNRWSAERLADEIRREQVRGTLSKTPGRGGPKAIYFRRRAVARMEAAVDTLKATLDQIGGEEISPDVARAAVEVLVDAQQICHRIEGRLRQYFKDSQTTPPPPLIDDSKNQDIPRCASIDNRPKSI